MRLATITINWPPCPQSYKAVLYFLKKNNNIMIIYYHREILQPDLYWRNKRTSESSRNWKNIHISYCEEKAVGPVRCSSHKAASLMLFHLKWLHLDSILSHLFEEWGEKTNNKIPKSLRVICWCFENTNLAYAAILGFTQQNFCPYTGALPSLMGIT